MKKKKADRSLWLGQDLGEESPMGSIKSIQDPTTDQSMDLKKLRRKFATRGKILKSDNDQKQVVGQTHKLFQATAKKSSNQWASAFAPESYIFQRNKELCFQGYVKPATHYFFFMVNGQCFVDTKGAQKKDEKNVYRPFSIAEYPGTNIQMNVITIMDRGKDPFTINS